MLWIFLSPKSVNKIATGRSLSHSGFLLLCFLKELFSCLPPAKSSVITWIQLMRNLSFGSYNVWRTGALTISSNNLKFTTLILIPLGSTEMNLFCNYLFSWQALSEKQGNVMKARYLLGSVTVCSVVAILGIFVSSTWSFNYRKNM